LGLENTEVKPTQEMKMAELKTKENTASVDDFLNTVKDEAKRADCVAIVDMMRAITKCEPKMWGSSIIGFDSYHYKYASGHEGDAALTGFSPRAQNITLYILAGFEQYDELMQKLGKYTTGKSCLYIKRLSDVHVPTLKKLIQASVKHMKKTNPAS